MESGYASQMAEVLDEFRNQGGAFSLNQAPFRLESGDIGRAYLESVKGYEMSPNLDGMFEIYRDTREWLHNLHNDAVSG